MRKLSEIQTAEMVFIKPFQLNENTNNGKKEKLKKIRFTESIKKEVIHLLSKDYSPEQIVGTLKLEGKETVSHEWIYRFIWEDKRKGGKLHKHLQTKGKRYRKRGSFKDKRGIIAERKSIEDCPEIVEKRCRIGDYEADLVLGKNHKKPF